MTPILHSGRAASRNWLEFDSARQDVFNSPPMKDRKFHKLVTVEPRLGKYRDVRSVADAGRVLLREWPKCYGPKHVKAMKAVLESLKGRKPPSHARTAFLAAAAEARITLPPREDGKREAAE